MISLADVKLAYVQACLCSR